MKILSTDKLHAVVCLVVGYLIFFFVDWNVLALIGIVGLVSCIGNIIVDMLPASARQVMADCQRKCVLITGCDSGFGNSLALRLDAIGFRVYAGCLDVNSAGAHRLKAAASDLLQLVPLDVTDQRQVDAAVDHVTRTLDERSKPLKEICQFSANLSRLFFCCFNVVIDTFDTVKNFGPLSITPAWRTCCPIWKCSPSTASIASCKSTPSLLCAWPTRSCHCWGSRKGALSSPPASQARLETILYDIHQ